MPYAKFLDKAAYNKAYQAKYISYCKELAYKKLGDKCICCGESNRVFLSIDHVQDDGYIHRTKHGRRTTAIYVEIARGKETHIYQLLCMNCNWAKRYGDCPHKIIPL